jgi:integrase
MPTAKTLATRDARSKLRPHHDPYWHAVKQGLAIGYRKGPTAAEWYVRRYADGRYVKGTLGTPDDALPADGERVLSWSQVLKKALGDDAQAATAAKETRWSVTEALIAYLDHRRAGSRSAHSVTIDEGRLRLHVIPKFGDSQVSELTTEDLERWRDAMVAQALEARPATDTEAARRDAHRRAQATAQRTWHVFRALLHYAFTSGRVPSDNAWRRIEPYRHIDKPRDRFLSVVECQRLLNASAPDFRALARGAMLTGLRYGELTRLTVAEYLGDVLLIGAGKSNQDRRLPLTSEGVEFFDEVTAGKAGTALIFTRSDGSAWGPHFQTRPMEAACKAGKIEPRATFHSLRHTYGSLLVNQGASLTIISKALGHADTRMTSRVYAHLQEDVLRRELEKALPRIGAPTATTVKRIDRAKASRPRS